MLLSLVLALATASAPAPIVAAPGFTSVEAPPGAAAAYSAHLERKLGEEGLQVVPAATLAARAGPERWSALRGCDREQASCRTELAGLAGAKAVLTGVITSTPRGLQVHVRILDAASGRVLAEEQVTSAGRFDLTRGLTEAAKRLAPKVGAALGVQVSPPMSLSRWALVPAGVGIAAAGVSTVFFVGANGKYRTLDKEPDRNALTLTEVQALRSSGESKQRLGFVFAGLSAASLAGSFALFYLGAEERPGIITGVSVDPTQRALVLSGVLP